MHDDKFFIPNHITINGGKTLRDNAAVSISGAKNEVLGSMAAAVLTDRPVVLHNVPHISDVLDMGHIMNDLGVDIRHDPKTRVLWIHAEKISSNILSDAAYKFRASYYIWGALMARFAATGEFDRLVIKVPGGCSFGGKRAIDYHLDLMRNIFGARIKTADTTMELILPKRLPENKSPLYSTRKMSHGATFHWMLAAATSPQTKMIYNASMEPEVPHLLGELNKMGANLRGTGTTGIMSTGRGGLLNGANIEIMPDRLETASYALLAMGLRDKIKLNGTDAESCRPWLNSVIEIAGKNSVSVSPDGESMSFDFSNMCEFHGQKFLMSPIPGKETDLHQIWAPVLSSAITASEIYDPIWPGRHGHLPELAKFGLDSSFEILKIKNSVAKNALNIEIRPSLLRPAIVSGMDLRGTFGLIVAAAMANGQSDIESPSFALRGYPEMIQNLQNIGINVIQTSDGQFIKPLPQITR